MPIFSNEPPRSPAVRQLFPPTSRPHVHTSAHPVLAEVQDDVAGLLLEDPADQPVRLLEFLEARSLAIVP